MKTIANLLTSLIVAFWIVAIAILSLKNVTPVALTFLTFKSIKLPFFLILAFGAAAGIILTSLIQPLGRRSAFSANDSQLDDEDFFDDEDI